MRKEKLEAAEKRVEEMTGGKVCVQRGVCCNKTVEHPVLSKTTANAIKRED